MNKKILALVMGCALASGCSSIVSKSDYAVAINSNPGGASFVITNRDGQKVESGVTPSTVTLSSSSGYFKGESYTVVLQKEGYSEKTYTLTSSIDGWYFGNILLGGLIGMLIVDPATGAMYNLPERADISLDANTASAPNGELRIATLDSLSEDQKLALVKI
ncbi:hypothetical protein [Paraferrimonas sedimenticola]|uniref:PEGA domain-containing protein n=1 Tax=Paraferrimonas sedimenticola TaxID=375674 RepID=A0AA37RWC2_9GAMM|nr:hypothetical protein [Paraferrimonas sedimenticola]GLP96471.1 hypothetical protein GCM10007895_17770 [Paraferrimonas sedimenticola]